MPVHQYPIVSPSLVSVVRSIDFPLGVTHQVGWLNHRVRCFFVSKPEQLSSEDVKKIIELGCKSPLRINVKKRSNAAYIPDCSSLTRRDGQVFSNSIRIRASFDVDKTNYDGKEWYDKGNKGGREGSGPLIVYRGFLIKV